MKILVLIVVTLLLAITTESNEDVEYKFGDIIAFPRTKLCCGKEITYKHYGVYIGKQRFPDQQQDEDLFHLTGSAKNPLRKKRISDCEFGILKEEGEHKRDNYLDDILKLEGIEPSEADMAKRIEEKIHNCGDWLPFRNNCEHIATYVRYGYKISLQCGQSFANLVKNPDVDNKLIERIKEKLTNLHCPDTCPVEKKTV